jgi:hypothetical protein
VAAPVRKVVGSESGPAITAVFLAAGLHDAWGLLVKHLGCWALSDNLFLLGSMGLFFLFRRTPGAAPVPPTGPDARELIDKSAAAAVHAAARTIREHKSDDRETVARAVERLAAPAPAP